MQAIIQEFEGKADAITAKVKAGEISPPQAIASLFGELFAAVAKASAVSDTEAASALSEWVMPPLGADGLIGRTYMLKVKKQGAAVADSALYLHKTGNTESDLRSFRPDLILRKAANRQKFKCSAVADAASWLFMNTEVNGNGLFWNDRASILDARRILADDDQDRAAIADAAEWLFQRVAFYTDETAQHAQCSSDTLERMPVTDIVRVFTDALAVYDEARAKVADAAWYLLECGELYSIDPQAPASLLVQAADTSRNRRRVIAGQARWLHEIESWTADDLADASTVEIQAAQYRSFVQYQSNRLKTAEYGEFLYLFGISTEATLRARPAAAIRSAGENATHRFNQARTKSADKAWSLFDDGFTPFALGRLVALDAL